MTTTPTPPHAPHAIVLRTAGTNCDAEMVRAFTLAGARAQLIHIDRLIDDPSILDDADLIGFPGGFSYGDDIGAGRVLGVRVRQRLYPALRDAAKRGVLMIGACNGFQVLVQTGLLPGFPENDWPDAAPEPTVALAENAGARFIDRWVRMEVPANTKCVWTQGIVFPTDAMMLPIAHGEGRLIASSPDTIAALQRTGQIAIRYASDDNPNGSTADIAGICDPSGRIFGLMPHPERYLSWFNHPFWTRVPQDQRQGVTPGLQIFRNAVDAVRSVPA